MSFCAVCECAFLLIRIIYFIRMFRNVMAEYRQAAANCRFCYVRTARTANSVASRKHQLHPTTSDFELPTPKTIFPFWTMRNKSFLHSIFGRNMKLKRLRSQNSPSNWTLNMVRCLKMNCYYFIYSYYIPKYPRVFRFFVLISLVVFGADCGRRLRMIIITMELELLRADFFVIRTSKKCLKVAITVWFSMRQCDSASLRHHAQRRNSLLQLVVEWVSYSVQNVDWATFFLPKKNNEK